jgi:uncharacterized protein (UPF0332 family)
LKGKNKKINIKLELSRGEEAIEAAEMLFEKNLFPDAVSRVYYAVFHHLKAILFTIGHEPRSHEGALHLFNIHFLKTGEFPPKYGKVLKRIKKHREESDYKATVIFTKENTQGDLREMRQFCREIKDFLIKNNYLK